MFGNIRDIPTPNLAANSAYRNLGGVYSKYHRMAGFITMATTTPNYGWPVPTSTDFVKDGATAIEALGDAIDATVFGLGSSGLTLINTTTFSAVSSQSINNVFSSTYQNYRIVFSGGVSASATGGTISMKMRVGGVDNSSAVYNYAGLAMAATSAGLTASSQTSTIIGYASFNSTDSNWGTFVMDVIKPFTTSWTHFFSQSNGVNASNQDAWLSLGGNHRATTSYDGFTISFLSATSGTIRVYGYQN